MQLNLPILSLDIIDSLSYQKCLLPKDKFAKNFKPGQWAKCYFKEVSSEYQYYAVTQIFPRADLIEVCYLDTCVTSYDRERDKQLVLDTIMILANRKEIKAVDVIFQLNSEYFIENSSFLTRTYLYELSKILLQKYHITHGSLIIDNYLQDNGIDVVCIETDNGNDDDCTNIITDNTKVNIKTVCLTYKVLNPSLQSLNVEPFVRTCQDLEDLTKLMHLQRCSQKRSFYKSLNMVLVGPVGCGKTTLVEDFIRNNRFNVFKIKTTNCLKPYPGETEAELRKVFKAACNFKNQFKTKEPIIVLLEDIHLLCPQSISAKSNSSEDINYMRICSQLLSLVDELFKYGSDISCWATTSKPDNLSELVRRPGRFENEISIPQLQENHRRDILRQLLRPYITSFNITPAVLETMAKQTQGYVLADLALLVRNVTKVILTNSEENLQYIVNDMLRKFKPISLKGNDVNAYKTIETFDSIGGMLELKKILEVSILAGIKHHESFKRFGLSLPKGILLYGPPGCAKTTIAKCLATEANMTFIATSGAEVYSPYVGCAEKFIAKIFQTARKSAPCLIFLDEIDSLVGRRSLTSSSNSGDVQVRILSTLLTEMDGVAAPTGLNSHIIVVAATNRPDMVDDALMRPGRFDKLIHVPAPDLLSRRSILDLYKQKMPFSKSLDIDAIAARLENYSGADICNLCNEAAMEAFQRDFNSTEILTEDFENVLKTSKSSLTQSQISWYYEFEKKK